MSTPPPVAPAAEPHTIARLPRDHTGRPVPWFVATIDGAPDFRIIGAGKLAAAHERRLCWVCGLPLMAVVTFPVGCMCVVNQVSPEPPSHPACALYSATHCPFLSTPNMRRRPVDPALGASEPAGIMLHRNPGVVALWQTCHYERFPVGDGYLWDLGGRPASVRWYAQGQPASRATILAAINAGLPVLSELAAAESPEAVAELDAAYQRVITTWLPSQ